MLKIIKFAFLTALILLLFNINIFSLNKDSTADADTKQIIETISAKQGYKMIQDNKDNPKFKIIDVRTLGEYLTGYVEDAENIDYNSRDFERKLKKLDKNNTYLIYCRSGNRSKKALIIFKKLKFKKVYDMGGIIDWNAEGYPVVK